jgi:hypothetical protein
MAEPPSFLGPPGRLRWAAADGAPTGVELPETLAPYVDPRRPVLRSARDPSHVRLRLAPTTPPGSYRIALTCADGAQREASIAVEPRSRLRVVPGTLRLAGAPGKPASAQLLVENRGNQPIEIGDTLVCGLFDNGGIEAALAAMYRLETDDLHQIVGTGFARLRAAHGGLLKLRVNDGAGTLAPGQKRLLQLDTTLGRKLAPRHGYHGTVELGSHRIAVQVCVT